MAFPALRAVLRAAMEAAAPAAKAPASDRTAQTSASARATALAKIIRLKAGLTASLLHCSLEYHKPEQASTELGPNGPKAVEVMRLWG